MFYKTDPPKSGNSDSKYNFQIFKNKNQTQKRPPKFSKYQKIYKEATNQKLLLKQTPKSGNSDSKFNI